MNLITRRDGHQVREGEEIEFKLNYAGVLFNQVLDYVNGLD